MDENCVVGGTRKHKKPSTIVTSFGNSWTGTPRTSSFTESDAPGITD
jgi:hypothetical protein